MIKNKSIYKTIGKEAETLEEIAEETEACIDSRYLSIRKKLNRLLDQEGCLTQEELGKRLGGVSKERARQYLRLTGLYDRWKKLKEPNCYKSELTKQDLSKLLGFVTIASALNPTGCLK